MSGATPNAEDTDKPVWLIYSNCQAAACAALLPRIQDLSQQVNIKYLFIHSLEEPGHGWETIPAAYMDGVTCVWEQISEGFPKAREELHRRLPKGVRRIRFPAFTAPSSLAIQKRPIRSKVACCYIRKQSRAKRRQWNSPMAKAISCSSASSRSSGDNRTPPISIYSMSCMPTIILRCRLSLRQQLPRKQKLLLPGALRQKKISRKTRYLNNLSTYTWKGSLIHTIARRVTSATLLGNLRSKNWPPRHILLGYASPCTIGNARRQSEETFTGCPIGRAAVMPTYRAWRNLEGTPHDERTGSTEFRE